MAGTACLAAWLGSATAAHAGGVSIGIGIPGPYYGRPYYYGGYYGPYYRPYYYAPVVVAPPPVYVQPAPFYQPVYAAPTAAVTTAPTTAAVPQVSPAPAVNPVRPA